jgi:hypothetical protein
VGCKGTRALWDVKEPEPWSKVVHEKGNRVLFGTDS